ncbi:glycoside hydrolase family 108 protein [Camelimonas abortus]|uniref:Glycoside hydrolase family 108 protein n=1 Tax=Camelimonas abortus TaxID=1017184 RepID=A0ABV7LH77_9HYPH
MAASTYKEALSAVLKHEGGYVNHPADPGGATNRGVTQRVYDAERKRRGLPTRSVRQITDAELQAIYRQQYWEKIRGDDLPPGVDYVVFDGAVNSGVAQSAKWLQRALGVRVDGIIGNATIAACWDVKDHDALIADICARRMAFLQALKTWPTFGKGWSRRVSDVLRTGQQWARGKVGPAVTVVEPGMSAKANVEDARPLPSSGMADAAIGGGSVLGVIGGALEGARDALTPLAGGSATVNGIVAVLVVAGVALAVGGAIWRAQQQRKAAQVADALGYAVAA